MDAAALLSHEFPEIGHRYETAFTMLYGLSIGLGGDPLDERQLRYVLEDGAGGPRAFPTLAVVLATPALWFREPRFQMDWRRVLQGEQHLAVHEPIPPEGRVTARFRVVEIDDKGPEKGAIIHTERSLRSADTGALLATLRQSTFARGDGGFGGDNTSRPTTWARPGRPPDHICELPTPLNAALIYRLTGDRNPLHADPAVARDAGFERPILHGLCTYGVIAHALVRTVAGYDAVRLRQLGGRFAAPVTPGETISTRVWVESEEIIFDAQVGERTVFTHGRAHFDG